jgi:hypothetical protein
MADLKSWPAYRGGLMAEPECQLINERSLPANQKSSPAEPVRRAILTAVKAASGAVAVM